MITECSFNWQKKEKELWIKFGTNAYALTPNICLRSGSRNLKGILETWSLLGWAFPAPSSSLPLPVPLPDATGSDVTGAKESSYEGDRNER